MSTKIRDERDAYYGGLKETQKGTLDITARLDWFLLCMDHALDSAETTLAAVLRKARFWESHVILDLVKRGVLAKDTGGGRSTSYSLSDME
jgi:Fic family protein